MGALSAHKFSSQAVEHVTLVASRGGSCGKGGSLFSGGVKGEIDVLTSSR